MYAVASTGPDLGYNVEMDIRLATYLLPPNNVPTPDQQYLFVTLNKTDTVIGTVYQQFALAPRDGSGNVLKMTSEVCICLANTWTS